MPAKDPQTPSLRPLRVGEELRHALADIVARGGLSRDPALDGLILTVTEVRVTPDLRTATVFVRALGHKDESGLAKTLANNVKWLRAEIAKRVRLRVVPELRFRTDESFDTAAQIEALLRRPDVARDLS